MKRKILARTLASCAMASLLAGGTVSARQASGGNGPASEPPAPASTAKLSPTSRPRQSERLSQLMGQPVKDQIGNTLGQITDFVVHPASGRIQFAVVTLSDKAGKMVAVPWQLMKPTSDTTSTTLAVTKEKLDSAPAFDANSWPDFTQPATNQQIYAHYGMQPRAGAWSATSGNANGSEEPNTKPEANGENGHSGEGTTGAGTPPK